MAGDSTPPERPRPSRADLEAALVRIWSELLGVQDVHVDDDFFEIGGNSVHIVQLGEAIERSLGLRLPLEALIGSGTIERLAEALDRPPAAASQHSVATLREGDLGEALALMPMAHGNHTDYVHLVRHLRWRGAVLGFLAPGLGPGEPVLGTIEEVAAALAGTLVELCPGGPHRLVGYSFAGRTAFAVAHALLDAGEPDVRVALVTPGPPIHVRPEGLTDDAPTLLARWFQRWFDLRLEADQVEGAGDDELIDRYLEAARRRGRIETTPDWYPLDDLALAHRYVKVFHATFVAAWTHVPRVFPGAVTLFTNPERGGEPFQRERESWAPYAPGGLNVVVTAGDHDTTMREPDVAALARQVEHWSDSAIAPGPG